MKQCNNLLYQLLELIAKAYRSIFSVFQLSTEKKKKENKEYLKQSTVKVNTLFLLEQFYNTGELGLAFKQF